VPECVLRTAAQGIGKAFQRVGSDRMRKLMNDNALINSREFFSRHSAGS